MKSIRKAIAVLVLGVVAIGSVVVLGPIVPATAQSADSGAVLTVGPGFQGEVTQKFMPCCLVLINGIPYELGRYLYDTVEVGMILRFDGAGWEIVDNGTQALEPE